MFTNMTGSAVGSPAFAAVKVSCNCAATNIKLIIKKNLNAHMYNEDVRALDY